MKGLIQRVSEARVVVDGNTVGEIARGIRMLLGDQKGDDGACMETLLDMVLA